MTYINTYVYTPIHISSLSSIDFSLQEALYSLLFPSPVSYCTVKLSLYLHDCLAVILSHKLSSPQMIFVPNVHYSPLEIMLLSTAKDRLAGLTELMIFLVEKILPSKVAGVRFIRRTPPTKQHSNSAGCWSRKPIMH